MEQGERNVMLINRNRTRPRRIDPDANDAIRGERGNFASLLKRAEYGSFQPEDIIAGMLPGDVMIVRIEQNTILAAGVSKDAGSEFTAAGDIDDDGAHRVRTVINSEGERHRRGILGNEPAHAQEFPMRLRELPEALALTAAGARGHGPG